MAYRSVVELILQTCVTDAPYLLDLVLHTSLPGETFPRLFQGT